MAGSRSATLCRSLLRGSPQGEFKIFSINLDSGSQAELVKQALSEVEDAKGWGKVDPKDGA